MVMHTNIKKKYYHFFMACGDFPVKCEHELVTGFWLWFDWLHSEEKNSPTISAPQNVLLINQEH